MKGELAPPLGGDALAPLPARRLVGVFGAALAAALLFWALLLFGGPLHGHDWSSHHYHYFDWVRIALSQHGTLPLYMADAWVTPNFLANAEAPTLGPLVWLLWLLPTGAYVKLLIVVFTAAGLAGTYLLLRDLEVSPALAVLAAAVFACNGFFTSHLGVGHHWAMGAYLLPALFWLYRRAALGSDGALLAAALLNAFTILGGQHQPFIWQNLWLSGFAVLWALRVRAGFPLSRWALVLLATAGLAAVKLLPLWAEFADYAPMARIQGLPLGALLTALTAGGQGPELADPRIAYAHGAGWWEYAFYVGPVALACLAVGCLAARGSWPGLAIGVFFLALSVESVGRLGLWPLLEDLPVWRSQRAPSRFLFLALFAFLVVAALGGERLRARVQAQRRRALTVFVWGLALWVSADLWAESRVWQRAATGPAIATVDHRPRPLRVQAPGVRAELREFAPNRLLYSVEARRVAQVVLPLRFGRRGAPEAEWQVESKAGPEAGAWRPLEQGGRLALEVPPGEHEVVLHYRPPGLRAGAALSLACGLLCGALALWRWRRRAAS
jgi:hypothetical protein